MCSVDSVVIYTAVDRRVASPVHRAVYVREVAQLDTGYALGGRLMPFVSRYRQTSCARESSSSAPVILSPCRETTYTQRFDIHPVFSVVCSGGSACRNWLLEKNLHVGNCPD